MNTAAVTPKRRVGFFDDEPAFLESMLRWSGEIDVVTTGDPDIVREWLQSASIDVLVSDYRVPYIGDVVGFLEDIRDQFSRVRIIVTTAFGVDDYQMRRLQNIGIDVVRKDEQVRLIREIQSRPISENAENIGRLQEEIEHLKATQKLLILDLIEELRQIPSPERLPISTGNPEYTVAALIRDLEQQDPRAKEFIPLWVRLKSRLRRRGRSL